MEEEEVVRGVSIWIQAEWQLTWMAQINKNYSKIILPWLDFCGGY